MPINSSRDLHSQQVKSRKPNKQSLKLQKQAVKKSWVKGETMSNEEPAEEPVEEQETTEIAIEQPTTTLHVNADPQEEEKKKTVSSYQVQDIDYWCGYELRRKEQFSLKDQHYINDLVVDFVEDDSLFK